MEKKTVQGIEFFSKSIDYTEDTLTPTQALIIVFTFVAGLFVIAHLIGGVSVLPY